MRVEDVPDVIHVPRLRQGATFTCGVTALQSVLYYYDSQDEYRENDLANLLKPDPVNGTVLKNRAEFAESIGYRATSQHNMSLSDLEFMSVAECL